MNSTQSYKVTNNLPNASEDELLLKFISPSSFRFPSRTSVGSGWAEHAPFAFWLIDAFRPKVVVELGTHTGYSFAAFCQAAQELRIALRCYAIDTWRGDEHAGFYKDEVFDEVSSYIGARYSSFARLIRSTFDEALVHFDDATVDFLHVDGRHYYEDAKYDYTSWIPKLSPNAIVLFHDINVRENNFGVYRLWDELKRQHLHFEFLHGHGLGIIATGSDIPEPVRSLLSLSGQPSAVSWVQEVYARLGKAISHHYELLHLQGMRREFDALQQHSSALQGGIVERDSEIIALRAEQAKLKNELASAGLASRAPRLADPNLPSGVGALSSSDIPFLGS